VVVLITPRRGWINRWVRRFRVLYIGSISGTTYPADNLSWVSPTTLRIEIIIIITKKDQLLTVAELYLEIAAEWKKLGRAALSAVVDFCRLAVL